MPSAIEFIEEPEIGIDPLTVATASQEGYRSDEIAPFRLRKQDIEDLVIKVQGFGNKGRARSQSIMGNVTECMIEDSIDQPNSVVVTVHDPDWDLLNSGALEFPIDINPGKLPHRWYRLDSYDVSDDDITLTFIVRNAIYLAGHKRPYSISRNKVTRAQFILTMLHHVKKADIKFFCPQLKKKQKIAKYASDTVRKNARERGNGFTPSDKIQVMNRPPGGAAPANAKQRDTISRMIEAGVDRNAPPLVIVAGVMTLFTESNAGVNVSGNPPYVGPLQQNHADGWPGTGDVYKDAVGDGSLGKKEGGFYGWAIPIWNSYDTEPDLGIFIEKVQGVTGSTNPANAGYAMITNRGRAVAQHAVNAWGVNVNDPGQSFTTSTQKESYHYGVGVEPYGVVGENYLAASHRLADQVQWALYWVKDVLHFQEYDELFKAKARTRVRRNAGGVEGVSFGYDRMKKVDKMRLKVRMHLWTAPVGTVVVFDEGDANVQGRWLITNIRRSVFDELGEIELSKPKNSKLEPPASEKTITSDQQLPGATNMADAPALYKSMRQAALDGGAKGIVEQAYAIAVEAGGDVITVISDYRANSITDSGNVSDHSGNNSEKAARDISLYRDGFSGTRGPPDLAPELDKAVVAIGKAFNRPSYGDGKHPIVELGFEFVGFRCQIFWRTDNPKDHLGHIHVGAHRSAIHSPSPAPR